MGKPRILFIDWNNTLSKSKFWGHLESSSASDLELFNKLEKSLFIKNLHLLKPWMKGDFTTSEMMNIIAKDTKIDINFVLNNFIKSCEKMVFVSKTIPNLIKQTHDLTVGVLGIISNFIKVKIKFALNLFYLDFQYIFE